MSFEAGENSEPVLQMQRGVHLQADILYVVLWYVCGGGVAPMCFVDLEHPMREMLLRRLRKYS